MEKRVLGIILTLLGIIGLVWAAIDFVQGSSRTGKSIAVAGILGVLFFFAGIGLIRGTKDKPT